MYQVIESAAAMKPNIAQHIHFNGLPPLSLYAVFTLLQSRSRK